MDNPRHINQKIRAKPELIRNPVATLTQWYPLARILAGGASAQKGLGPVSLSGRLSGVLDTSGLDRYLPGSRGSGAAPGGPSTNHTQGGKSAQRETRRGVAQRSLSVLPVRLPRPASPIKQTLRDVRSGPCNRHGEVASPNTKE